MKKIVFLLICFLNCLNSHLSANDDLLRLFHLAVENGDVKLVADVIEALLKEKSSNTHLLEAIAKYGVKGRIDFSLHKAIKDKNLISSVILTRHTKDLDARQEGEILWRSSGMGYAGSSSAGKTPLELALESDMIEMIPYLLMKGASPYTTRNIDFFYEGEENLEFLEKLGNKTTKKICAKSRKEYLRLSVSRIVRTFIGELICKNRIDIIEMLQKMFTIDWNKTCCTSIGMDFSPLQLALTIERYEIAQFLIDHGARID